MMEPNKKTTKLSEELNAFLARRTKKEFTQGLKLHTAWEAVATLKSLEHTDNVVFSTRATQPVILVYVDDARWAAELTATKEICRFMMERELKQPIHTIEFLVSKSDTFKKVFKKSKPQQKQEASKKKVQNLTKEEEQEIQNLTAPIKDTKLKERLYSAIKKDTEWKKST
jgi:hypothetical protein